MCSRILYVELGLIVLAAILVGAAPFLEPAIVIVMIVAVPVIIPMTVLALP